MSDHAWVFGLVDPRDEVRRRALARHQAVLAAASGLPSYTALLERRRETIDGPLETFNCTDDLAVRTRWAPFVVLYLRWEAEFPAEWDARGSSLWSRWTKKEVVLGRLDRLGIPAPVRPEIADLIVAALHRPYRCKDWMYARLARQFAGTGELTDRVRALTDSADESTRLRARFVLDAVRHPERRVTRSSWKRWLPSAGR